MNAMLSASMNILVTVISSKNKCEKKIFVFLLEQIGMKYCGAPVTLKTGTILITAN